MRSVLVLIAGVVMLLSSLAHGLVGWPMMRGLLRDGGAGEDLIGALAVGWYFGSVAMVAFGSIAIVAALRLRRGDRSGVAPGRLIALCYVLFGLAAFLSRGFNPHFLLFVATGLLAGLPLSGGAAVRRGPGPGAS